MMGRQEKIEFELVRTDKIALDLTINMTSHIEPLCSLLRVIEINTHC